MGQPHKHAEILRAIADGKDVQYRENQGGLWVDRRDDYCDHDPITHEDYFWRIKPEPKPDVVQFHRIEKDCRDYMVSGIQTSGVNLKLTFDGETGDLKDAEVLK